MTGYPHGANTPIGIFIHHPDYPMFFDSTIQEHQKVIISAGELGKVVVIATSDLIEIIEPVVADLLK